MFVSSERGTQEGVATLRTRKRPFISFAYGKFFAITFFPVVAPLIFHFSFSSLPATLSSHVEYLFQLFSYLLLLLCHRRFSFCIFPTFILVVDVNHDITIFYASRNIE